MKGVIFTELGKMVEEKFGMVLWQEVITASNLPSKGVYTSGATYDDKELYAILKELSKKLGKDVEYLIKDFGHWMLLSLSKKYQVFFKDSSAKHFLMSIHNVVHVEVKKLYYNAEPPVFSYEDVNENNLVMIYISERSLCSLAEGLIDGVSEYYITPISYTQTKCKHRGDDHCRFELKFG